MLDSGCTQHMTGNSRIFDSINENESNGIDSITFDDIIFGSTNQDFCEKFGKMMASEFEMSMIGELSYFLDLQIKQMKNDTFMS